MGEIQEIHNVRQYLDNMQTSHVNEDTRTKQNEKHGEKRKVYHEVEDNKSKKKRKCVKFPMMNKRELFWNEKYSELREYFNVHGHCRAPYINKTLGQWVQNQRRQKKSLSEDKIEKLNEIKFVWNVNLSWDERYSELREYFNLHGDCRVPYINKTLGVWVHNQR